MKIHCSGACALAFLFASEMASASVVPIGSYGNVFPSFTEANISFFVGSAAPWYITFNLVESASVKLGAIALPSVQSGGFVLSAVRIVTGDGNPVPGVVSTDSFVNPFPDPIERLSFKNFLSPGLYALEVNGSGNSVVNGCGRVCDGLDFTVRLQVSPAVPEPGTYALLFAGLGVLACVGRRFKQT